MREQRDSWNVNLLLTLRARADLMVRRNKPSGSFFSRRILGWYVLMKQETRDKYCGSILIPFVSDAESQHWGVQVMWACSCEIGTYQPQKIQSIRVVLETGCQVVILRKRSLDILLIIWTHQGWKYYNSIRRQWANFWLEPNYDVVITHPGSKGQADSCKSYRLD